MAAGFRDILAWLLGWQSNHPVWQTAGPYKLVAGGISCSGANAADVFQSGAVASAVSGSNIIAGQCNG